MYANADPDAQRALVYQARALYDMSLVPIRKQRALVTDGGQEGDTITVQIGSKAALVDISRRTQILLAHGGKGTIADVQTGDTIEVTGIRNNRLGEVT